jgi:hypothetical protein
MGVGDGADMEDLEEENAGVQTAGSEAMQKESDLGLLAKEFAVCVRTV